MPCAVLLHAGCTAVKQLVTCNNISIPPGHSLTISVIAQGVLVGQHTINTTINGTNSSTSTGNVDVYRTCAHYNSDGGAFSCAAGTTFNRSASNYNRPSARFCSIRASSNNTGICTPDLSLKANLSGVLVVTESTVLAIVVLVKKCNATNVSRSMLPSLRTWR